MSWQGGGLVCGRADERGIQEDSHRTRAWLDRTAVVSLDCQMSGNPHLTSRQEDSRSARQERLAKALRENLHRRKEQARAQKQLRSSQSKKPEGGSSEPPA